MPGLVRHFIVGRGSPPESWDPRVPDVRLPRDCVYFGKVIAEMERQLDGEEVIDCYVTWDNDELPAYGPNIVAILIGEEFGLIPRYARHVRLVARVMGRKPFLGVRRWWPLNMLVLMLSIKHLRNLVRHYRSKFAFVHPPKSWPAPVHKEAAIVHIPWGSANLRDAPLVPVSLRSNSYFFSGGIRLGSSEGIRKYLGGPKIYSREALIRVMERIQTSFPRLSSSDALVVHASQNTDDLNDIEEYSAKMMNSKICFAPRGTVADTWRFFEGLKSGCVVITNPLPNEWYYRNAPVIQIDHWNQLEDILLPLLANEEKMNQIHQAALKYWQDVCGEKAVGKFLAFAIAAAKPVSAPNHQR